VRIVYAISLIFLSISSCLFVWKVRKEGGLTVHIRRFILCSVVAMSACIVTSYSQSEILSLAGYGVYFSALSWLLVFFVQFILEYTNYSSRTAAGVMVLFAVFVTVNAALNLKLRHVFSVTELIWVTDKNRYLILVPGLWYRILLGSDIAILILCAIALIAKTIETPHAYRPRYLVMLFMMSVIVALNTAFLVFNLPMDWSALFYVAFAIVAWFFSTRYIRTFLLSKTLAVIVDHLDTGLVIYDYMDAPVYLNERAKMMLGLEMSGLTESLEKWYETTKVSTLKSSIREFEVSRNASRLVYSVRFEELRDESGIYNGGFFALRDISEEKERERLDQYHREHDRLTNLYNQDAFLEKCAKILLDDPQGQYVMLRSETEVFESIRAVYGKDTKDAVIAGLGGIIKRKCYGKGAGGWMKDESFGLLLPVSAFSEKEMFRDVSEVLSEILGENAGTFRVRVGICPVNDRGCSARLIAEQAKVALGYIMKDDTAVVSWYTEGMRQKGITDCNLTESLAEALVNGEMRMYLQPILGSERQKVIGAEALVRWHRGGKVLLPGEFLPLLEKNEQIAAMDQFIWRQAAVQLRKWKEEGKEDLCITVNIARKDLYLLDVCGEFLKLISEYQIEPSLLHVDISTETMFLEKVYLRSVVRRLKDAGFRVNLDDFGSYYTAPVFLRDIRFDGIKVSRELIHVIESDATGKALTKSIVDMGKNLGVKVYAEGIETEREYKALKAMECDGYQGFFVSEPIPAEEFEQCGLFSKTD